jgi:hypothetical protein
MPPANAGDRGPTLLALPVAHSYLKGDTILTQGSVPEAALP